jgi:hypothetical protein
MACRKMKFNINFERFTVEDIRSGVVETYLLHGVTKKLRVGKAKILNALFWHNLFIHGPYAVRAVNPTVREVDYVGAFIKVQDQGGSDKTSSGADGAQAA